MRGDAVPRKWLHSSVQLGWSLVHQAHAEFIAAFDDMEAKLKTTQPKPNTKEDPKPMPKAVEPEIVEPDFVAHEEEILDVRDLVVMGTDGKPKTDSLTVAKAFGKEHRHVLRAIKELVDKGLPNFGRSNYLNKQNKSQPMFTMDRDGFTFLVTGFTGDRAFEFKKQYIAAFNAMEKKLMERKPATQLEVLVGVANGLLEQDKKLKEIEGKVL